MQTASESGNHFWVHQSWYPRLISKNKNSTKAWKLETAYTLDSYILQSKYFIFLFG